MAKSNNKGLVPAKEYLVAKSVRLLPETWAAVEELRALRGYKKASEYLRVMIEKGVETEIKALRSR